MYCTILPRSSWAHVLHGRQRERGAVGRALIRRWFGVEAPTVNQNINHGLNYHYQVAGTGR
eukprot:scaffold22012_cov21-Tisochrysis_lutea.AAC.1